MNASRDTIRRLIASLHHFVEVQDGVARAAFLETIEALYSGAPPTGGWLPSGDGDTDERRRGEHIRDELINIGHTMAERVVEIR